ncbi:hypothetical protein G7Y79_00033g068420 [Physcia stellaris]|nr:hypothetical protein G7Y79_00033g068420 [Physcia stellaris]
MNHIGHLPWEFPITDNIGISTADNPTVLFASDSPTEGPNQLHTKHLIRGMYDMGILMAGGPSYYRALANISVDDQLLGKVLIERRASTVDANATIDRVQSRDLGVFSTPLPARRGDIFAMSDPYDRSFRIHGTFTGDNPPIEKLFTASLNAMAQAAVHGSLQKAAEPINAISFGDTQSSYALIGIIDTAEVFESSGQLRYGQVLQAIACLWRMFRMGGKFGGLEAVIEFRRKEIGNLAIEGGSQVSPAR